jgi:hypothetical protein
MIRNRSFRRLVIATTLFMGLFTQFQMVFACEYKDGNLQLVCCCENSGDMSKSCAENNQCAEQQAAPISENTTCCDVSYQQAPSATAISSAQHNQQVLVLDAPQPPPILASFNLQTLPTANHTAQFFTDVSLRVAGAQTFLLTQRFRI